MKSKLHMSRSERWNGFWSAWACI